MPLLCCLVFNLYCPQKVFADGEQFLAARFEDSSDRVLIYPINAKSTATHMPNPAKK
jgi:hypothetical protein